MKSGKECAAQSRIHRAHVGGIQQAETARAASGRRVTSSATATSRGERSRVSDPAGRKPTPGTRSPIFSHSSRDAQRGVEFVIRAAGNPHQAEIAHRCAAGLRLSFEVDDAMSAFDGFPCVGGAQHATTHNGHPHGY